MSALEARLQAVDRRYKADRNLMLAVLAVGIVVQGLIFWLLQQPATVPPAPIHLTAVALTGPAALCPGDALEYAYTLRADTDAVVAVDAVVYRSSEPPGIAALSETRRVVLPAGASSTMTGSWPVGEGVLPGDYLRVLAVGTTTRNTVPEIRALPFSVGACK